MHRNIGYETAVIQSNYMIVRVTVEIRHLDQSERTGNWYSCVTDLNGHILGGQTNGSGNTSDSPLKIAQNLLEERIKRGRNQ